MEGCRFCFFFELFAEAPVFEANLAGLAPIGMSLITQKFAARSKMPPCRAGHIWRHSRRFRQGIEVGRANADGRAVLFGMTRMLLKRLLEANRTGGDQSGEDLSW